MTAAQELPYGFSPHSSVAAEFDDVFDPIHFDDDDYALADEDDDDGNNLHAASIADTDATVATTTGKQTKAGKRANFRKGPQNADKRATHNAVERKRRESLNDRFLELARVLPSTASLKRPSKAVVISKALDYVYETVNRERALIQENNDLRVEVDQLRASLGLPRLPPPQPLPERRMATAPTLRKSKKVTNGSISKEESVQPVAVAPLPTPSLSDAFTVAASVPAKQEPASPALPTPSEPSPPTTSLSATSPALYSAMSGGAVCAAAAHSSPSAASVASARTPSLVFDPTSIASSVTSLPFPGMYGASPDAHSPATVGSEPTRHEPVSPMSQQQQQAAANFYVQPPPPTSQGFSPTAAAPAMHPHVQAQAAQLMQAAMSANAAPQAYNPAAAAAAAAYINPAILFALQQQQHAQQLQAAQQQHHHHQQQHQQQQHAAAAAAAAAAAHAAAQHQQSLNVSEWLVGYNNAVAAQSGMLNAGVPSPSTASLPGGPHSFEGISF